MESSAADGEVINIGSGVPRPIGGGGRALAKMARVPGIEPTITCQLRRVDVRHCPADLTRARQLLGFQPRVGWEQGLTELVGWCQEAFAADRFAQAEQELRARGLLSEPLGPEGRTSSS